MYLNSHFTITTVTLAFLYLFRNEHFYFVRNMFMVAMGLALVGYVAFPTAPPRLMPEWASRTRSRTSRASTRRPPDALFNPYAAVPSMHVAFALMLACRWRGWRAARAVRALWGAYPPVVTFVVVATANHWWFDAFARRRHRRGLGALAAQTLLARARPHAWAWDPSARPAGA